MEKTLLPVVTIYTDGACNPNPGPGGWAAILLHPGLPPRELCGAEENTTNNRMEVLAAVRALQSLQEPAKVFLVTDSQYLCQGLERFAAVELFSEVDPAHPEEVKNSDLWQELAALLQRHQVEPKWVRGHQCDPFNERADSLATSMLPRAALPLEDENAIHLFTAASCLSAGSGPGGWAVVLRYRQHRKELKGGEPNTSSNQMHLEAALQGLVAVRNSLPIHLYTTSDYLRSGATSWVKSWQQNGWRTGDKKPVRYKERWEALVAAQGNRQINYFLLDSQSPSELMKKAQGLARQAARNQGAARGKAPA